MLVWLPPSLEWNSLNCKDRYFSKQIISNCLFYKPICSTTSDEWEGLSKDGHQMHPGTNKQCKILEGGGVGQEGVGAMGRRRVGRNMDWAWEEAAFSSYRAGTGLTKGSYCGLTQTREQIIPYPKDHSTCQISHPHGIQEKPLWCHCITIRGVS